MKKALFFTIAFLFVTTISSAQSLDDKINFKNQGATLNNLLIQLSEESGIEFKCTDNLKNEFLVIRCTDTHLLEITQKIAEVTHGKWTKSGDKYTLALSEKQNILDIDEYRRVVSKSVKKQIEERDDDLKSKTDYLYYSIEELLQQHQNEEDIEDNIIRKLCNSALEELINNVNSVHFTTLMNERQVYALKPNKQQNKMPISALPYLMELRNKYHSFLERNRHNTSISPSVNDINKCLDYQNQRINNILLVVNSYETRTKITLVLLNQHNITVHTSYTYLTDYGIPSDNKLEIVANEKTLTEEGTAILNNFKRTTKSESMYRPIQKDHMSLPFARGITQKEAEVIMHPSKFDPLKELISNQIITYYPEGNLICYLDDFLLRPFIFSRSSYSDAFKSAMKQGVQKEYVSDKWRVIKPTSVYHARLNRVDRVSFEKVIQKTSKNYTLIDLETVLEYSDSIQLGMSTEKWDYYWLYKMYGMSNSQGPILFTSFYPNSIQLYKIYSESGYPTTTLGLKSRAKVILDNLFHNNESYFAIQAGFENALVNKEYITSSLYLNFKSNQSNNIKQILTNLESTKNTNSNFIVQEDPYQFTSDENFERTVMFSDGVPNNSPISIKDYMSTILILVNESTNEMKLMNSVSYGENKASEQFSQNHERVSQFDKFAHGTETIRRISVGLSSYYKFNIVFSFQTLNSDLMEYNELPKEIRDEVKKSYDETVKDIIDR